MLPVGGWRAPSGAFPRAPGVMELPREPTFQDLQGSHWTVLLVCAPWGPRCDSVRSSCLGELEAIGILSQA